MKIKALLRKKDHSGKFVSFGLQKEKFLRSGLSMLNVVIIENI
jgi:hypothetical protein